MLLLFQSFKKQTNMLADKELKAFVPTVKPGEAKLFYQDILGLQLLSQDDYALEFNANGVLLRVIIVPELKPHPFTALGWNVGDMVPIIQALNKKGIFCEKYNFLEQDDLGIWTAPGGAKVAWFKDPDGNVLSLTE
ncbi:VOC family protein [Mucilaginibacter sp. PPCGB 2223]|uniref:VOC family protein n=1 Tax=Mucilaginibacter sp. PPCGB 2223 TaxID=1886027 RepID=UPI001111CC2F|nr:VOC family protein [Mucilaginibacter sp. PPCGB 2223]